MVNNDTALVPNLSPVTDYDAYVRAVCGTADTSFYSGVHSFSTGCVPYTPFYLEEFSTWTNNSNIPSCWEEYSDGDLLTGPTTPSSGDWIYDAFGNDASSPYSVSATVGSASIQLFNLGTSDWLVSPQFDLTTGGPFQLDFNYTLTVSNTTTIDKISDDDEVYLLISNDNGANWTTLTKWDSTTNIVSQNGDYATFDLTTYAGDTVMFAFYGTENTVDDASNVKFFFDNFRVRKIPTCFVTTNLENQVLFNGTDFDASFTWQDNSNAAEWEVQYGPAGFTLGQGTIVNVTDDSLYVNGGFSSLSDYEFYVRAICGAGDTAIWNFPAPFSTPCIPITPDHLESFDTWVSNASLMDCWTEYTAGDLITGPSTPNSGNWIYDDWLEVFGSSDNAARITLSGNNTSDWLVSPEFYFNNGGPYELNFYAALVLPNNITANFGSDDTIHLAYTNDGGNSWIALDNWNANNQPSSTGEYFNYDLTGITGVIQFGFLASDGTINDPENSEFMVNDFRVRAIPTCVEPINVYPSNISFNAIELSFDYTGTPIAWEIEAVASGNAQGTGVTTITSDYPVVATGLNPETEYDLYVRAICAIGDSSEYTQLSSVTTVCAPISAATGYLIDFETLNTNTTGNLGNCWQASYLPKYYWKSQNSTGSNTNSPNTGPIYDHTLGGSTAGGMYLYTESNTSSVYGDSTILYSPFIDFSNNNSPRVSFWYHMFGEAIGSLSLEVYENGTWVNLYTVNNQQQSTEDAQWLSQTINLFQYAGDTMQFRFLAIKGFGLPAFNGDIAIDDILFEDAPLSDVGVTAIVSPTASFCGSDEMPITIQVTNFSGITSYNVPVTVNVSGDITNTYNVVIDSIQGGENISYDLDTVNTALGANISIEAYSLFVGDLNNSNDTSNIDAIINVVPTALTVMDETICIGNSINFTNTSGLSVRWIDAIADTTISTNDVFTTVPLTTTSYQVEVFNKIDETIGFTPVNLPVSGNPANQSTGVMFFANQNVIIDSVDIYPSGDGKLLIGLYDEYNQVMIAQKYVLLDDGGVPYSKNTVYLGFEVPASNNRYKLVHLGTTGNLASIGRNLGDGSYPYASSNNEIILVGSTQSPNSSGSTDDTYFFYNWSISIPSCPSVRTTFEVVVSGSLDTLAVTACDSMMINGMNQTTSGFYADTIILVSGCYSIIVYDLTINETQTSIINDVLCAGTAYTLPDNSMVNDSGTYIITLPNGSSNGCDSLITVNLSLAPTTEAVFNGLSPEICDTAAIIAVNATPAGGTLSGNGIVGNNFNPLTAGLGNHTITYNFNDANNCNTTSTFDLEVISCIVGIKGISGINAINVYPNPFVNEFKVTFNDERSSNLKVTLFDVSGKKLYESNVTTNFGLNTIEVIIPNNNTREVFLQLERNGKTYQTNLIQK